MRSIINVFFVILRKVNNFAASLSEQTIFFCCIFITCILGAIDYYTTPEYSFAIFYLIPIFIVSWFSNRRYSFIISSLCIITAFTVNLHYPTTELTTYVKYWDAATNLVFFTLTAMLLLRLKEILLIESSLARTDHLTGISNSRYFYELAETEINRATRMNYYVSIVYIDLDNFKEVNDTLGHKEGDKVLRMASDALKNSVRDIDIIARIGGDEFVILMPNTNYEESRKVIERVKFMIDKVLLSKKWSVTASIGAVTCPGRECSLNALITTADQLMYEAKTSGKNKVIHKNIENRSSLHSTTDSSGK
jgi:diguanylate cyclase (GGDEF)-like protein